MSRGAMNKDVKYYCTGCQEKEQELTELKEMVRYRQYIQRMLNEGEIQVGGLGKLDATDKWLEQAVTLAKGDSKEEK